MTAKLDFDVAIVGSGFGGAVSALRLSQAGHRVLVLERGRRVTREQIAAAHTDLRKLTWAPEIGLNKGYFWTRMFRDVGIVGGAGVGGGSLVWAAVLLKPKPEFFADPAWAGIADWQMELDPHYETATRMLGRTVSPQLGIQDEYLRATAAALGREQTFGKTPLGIYFGEPGERAPDPYFEGEGPERSGCVMCGGCIAGCPHGAKNTLDLNYLWLAERRGARIDAESEVTAIKPSPGGGYELAVRHPWRSGTARVVRARRVVMAAGVLGTLELLFRCRDELGTLPNVSPALGQRVHTNSEAVTGILHRPGNDVARGTSISSDFYPDEHTHVTQNRYVGGSHMRFQLGPLVDGFDRRQRALQTLGALVTRPGRQARLLAARDFERRLTTLTVMQRAQGELSFSYRRSPLRPWRRVLRSGPRSGEPTPSYLPVANRVTREFARVSGGTPYNLLAETTAGLSITAHILGGATIAADPETGVIDARHELFGHPGVYVADAAAIPADLGVNPSLTITALAERFASLFPQP